LRVHQKFGARVAGNIDRLGKSGKCLSGRSPAHDRAKNRDRERFDNIGSIGRRFDLVIVGQPDRQKSSADQVVDEGVLFESGRPVIFVPFIQKGAAKLDRVMICWDGGRAAARAVADALPLLKKVKQVEVVIISNKPGKTTKYRALTLANILRGMVSK